MKKHRQGKENRKSIRTLAILMVLMMITALVLPIGARASESSDGSASGASQAAVSEEKTEKEEKKNPETEEKESSSESKTEKKEDQSDSSDNKREEEKPAVSEEKKEEEESTASDAVTEKKAEEASSDEPAGKDDSMQKKEQEVKEQEVREGVSDDSDGSDNPDYKAKNSGDNKASDSGNSARDTAADESRDKDAQAGSAATSTGKDDLAKDSADGGISAVEKAADSTITFETKEVTVIADRDAFDTEVTMKVKKVTDPEQLLKMVTAVQEEGGSYTVKAYTVTFYDKNGKEVEPRKPVQVNMNTKVAAPAKSKVVHVKDDDRTEILKADIDQSGASFEMDSFSDIGVATEGKAKIPGSSFDLYLGDELSTDYSVDDLPAGPISEKDLPEVEGYTFENATVGDAQVEEIGTITDEEGNVYVYYTTKDEKGEIKAAILGDGRIRIHLVETDKDTTYDLDADGAHVHIDAPAGAFDSGIYMDIQQVDLSDSQREQVQEQAAGKFAEDAELRFQAIDITFFDKNGQKVQPRKPVNVTLTTPDTVEGDFCVVHLSDDDHANRVQAVHSGDRNICFAADSFSIYIVVDDGSQLSEARATINFYRVDKNEEPISLYIKNSDTAGELENILYDPGVGVLGADELFKGWSLSEVNTENGKDYTTETKAMTIEDLRDFFAKVTIKEGDTYNIYPMIFKAYSIQFKDEDNVTIHSDILINKTGEPVTYEINTPYTPKEQDQEFQGWNVTTGSDKIHATDGVTNPPYQNETEVEISGNVILTVEAPKGFWLSFNENGSGVSYTPPQFIQKIGDTVTVEPDDPTRLGYTFDGWYENQECTGQPFTFGSKIDRRTTLYAKWTPVTKANYTVIVWHESMSDTYAENANDRHYDFVKSYTFTGNVSSTINAVTQASGTGNRVTDADGSYQNLRIQGTTPGNQTVNEIYSETGYHAARYDTGKTIAAEGTTVINVYYDRNAVTYTFYTQGGTGWTLCVHDSNSAFNGNVYTQSANGNYIRYSGTPRYGDGNTYYRQQSGCGGTYYEELVWKQGISGSWGVYQDSKGLYGESLNWPTDSGIWWYPDQNGSGTRMTYKDAFLPMDSDMTVQYWGRRTTGGGTVHFWTQNVEGGNNYTDKYNVSVSRNSGFNINDKFSGFYAYQYRVDNGSWQNVGELDPSSGVYGDQVGFSNRLDIRYNRVKNKITFMDGGYFDGNGNELDEEKYPDAFSQSPEYYFQEDVSAYNKGGTLYYVPNKYHEGYTFSGWYADDACTQPYDFTTMPSTGITVYAKWVQTQYRVFLHPNVPRTDSSLEWAQLNQEMNFRVTYGEQIAGGKMINGERADYELIGWYTDEACKKAFNFDAFVLNDTNVTGEYDKTVDMTDPMDKYGVLGNNPSNADVNRPWITKKLDLYAKWRSKLEGARGIDVVYDANGGTNAPDDPLQYLDSAEAIAQAASTPPDPNKQQFLHWVVQKWNGSEYEDTSTIVYPGDSFDVLKANARRENNPDSTGDEDKYIYTVKLRAEYGPNQAPKPTHIWWFPNDVSEGTMHDAMAADNDLQINEAVLIENPPTRDGYTFLGWARVNSATESQSSLPEGASTPQGKGLKLTADNLFLKYENGKFKGLVDGEWTEVEYVAADEKLDYHDMYAVWAPAIKVSKIVTGNMADKNKSFSFTATLSGDGDPVFGDQPQGSSVSINNGNKTATFTLKDGDSVTIAGVSPGATMTITETGADGYETSAEGISGGSFNENARQYTFTVPENTGEVTFTNDKTVVVDTGIKLDFMPYVLILGAAATGAALLLRRRKEV